MSGGKRSLAFAGIFLVSALSLVASASAAVYTVTPGAPDPVNYVADGTCDDDGVCSLREAVIEANATPSEDDTIVLPAGTISLTQAGSNEDAAVTGDLDITDTVTIKGAGQDATIISQDATPDDRVFSRLLTPSETLRFEDLTITGGTVGTLGAGVFIDGSALVEFVRVTVRDNVATSGTLDAHGGGIGIQGGGTVTLTDSTVSGNVAEHTDPANAAAAPEGGGISAGFGALELHNSQVIDNEVSAADPAAINGAGGGIDGSTATVTIEDSTIAGNSAPRGGAIFRSGGGLNPTSIASSTIADNHATRSSGGGIYSFAPTFTVANSTISGNTSAADGGGIRMSSGTFVLANVTLAENEAVGLGDGFSAVATTVVMERTVLANAEPDNVDNCAASGATVDGQGGNVQQAQGVPDADCDYAPVLGDFVVPDAGLLPLGDYGGPTQTHAITPTSSITNSLATLPCPGSIPVDQRGIARPGASGSGHCDPGAFEYSDTDTDTIEDGVDNCVNDANSDQADADGDGLGDACDPTPNGPDDDGDGIGAVLDNCPDVANTGQEDSDGDGLGDACDPADPPPAGSLDLQVSAPKKVKAAGPLTLTVRCTVECSVEASGVIRVPRSVKKSGRLPLKGASADLPAATDRDIKLTWGKAARKKLKKAIRKKGTRKRTKLELDVTASAAGGADAESFSVKFRRR